MGDLQDYDDALHRFMDSRLRGNDGNGCVVLLFARPPHLWIADQVRNDGLGYVVGVVLFTLTLVLSHQGRGG